MKRALARWLMCGLLVLVCLAVYLPVAESDFINLDDPDYVVNNLQVRQGLTENSIRWAFSTFHSDNWHPLTWLSHELDCQLYGLDPVGPHLTNLVFHLLNTVLLFMLLQNLTARLWAGAFVALLFGIHPMHVESVAWVSERKDVLSAFFFILTLLAYARYAQSATDDKYQVMRTATTARPSFLSPVTCHLSRFYWLALFFFALGLMSKPMLVTLPFVLLLLDFWPVQRFNRSTIQRLFVEKLPFFALTALSCAMTILAQREAMKPEVDFPLAARLAHVPVAYVWYLFRLIWPVEHSIFYILHVTHPSAEVAGALLLLGLVTGIVIRQVRPRPYLVFGWFWFLLMLVPVVGLVQVGNQAYAERYTYLPYIGLFIMLAWGIPELFGKWPSLKPLLWCPAIFVLVACGKLTADQVHVWKHAGTLFKQAVEEDKNNERAWILYGLQFNHARKPDQAIECLRQAIVIKPGSTEAWDDLGRILVVKGKYDEARSAYETALTGTELKPLIYKNLADLCAMTGKPREAITNYQASLAYQPDQPVVVLLLADAYAADNQSDQAIEGYQQVIRMLGKNVQAEMALAVIYGNEGREAEAIGHYRRVIGLDTNSVVALNNLAWLLATSSDPRLRNGAEAMRLARQACDLTGYGQAFLIGTLAAAYAEAGRFDDARNTAQKACEVALAHGQNEIASNNVRLMEMYRSGRAFHETARPAP